MIKHRVALIFLMILSLLGCSKDPVRIKGQFFSEDTLKEYNLIGMPTFDRKDSVLEDYCYYFDTTPILFEEWCLDLIDYFDGREDIVYWGHISGPALFQPTPFPVIKFEKKEEYYSREFLKIVFTTMELTEDNTFQNCYYISAYKSEPQTITVGKEEIKFEYVLAIDQYHKNANNYLAKDLI